MTGNPHVERDRVTLTAAMLREYSRSGNYHSDPDEARRLGVPGLLAQGMQAAGRAYSHVVRQWGEEFVASGELELRFVGPVWEGDTIEAVVTFLDDDETATIEIANLSRGHTAVVGTARRRT